MQPISYARHQFPPEIIRHAVWLYLRFTLSYRDLEELLAERGLDISYEGIVNLTGSLAFLGISARSRQRTFNGLGLDGMA